MVIGLALTNGTDMSSRLVDSSGNNAGTVTAWPVAGDTGHYRVYVLVESTDTPQPVYFSAKYAVTTGGNTAAMSAGGCVDLNYPGATEYLTPLEQNTLAAAVVALGLDTTTPGNTPAPGDEDGLARVEDLPSGGLTAQQMRDALDLTATAGGAGIDTQLAAIAVVTGANPTGTAKTVQCNDVSGNPVAGVLVYTSSDQAGRTLVGGPAISDSGGLATLILGRGTQYVQMLKAGYSRPPAQQIAV